jgi:hypothetical protein
MTIVLTIAVTLAVLFFTLRIRESDLPEPIPVSPLQHLEDRKAAIYENLRDLQFEFRVGKLSDADYQATKLALQKELAVVLSEMEETAAKLGISTKRTPVAKPAVAAAVAKQKPAAAKAAASFDCPHCGASFEKPLKFCGECGKAMA